MASNNASYSSREEGLLPAQSETTTCASDGSQTTSPVNSSLNDVIESVPESVPTASTSSAGPARRVCFSMLERHLLKLDQLARSTKILLALIPFIVTVLELLFQVQSNHISQKGDRLAENALNLQKWEDCQDREVSIQLIIWKPDRILMARKYEIPLHVNNTEQLPLINFLEQNV